MAESLAKQKVDYANLFELYA